MIASTPQLYGYELVLEHMKSGKTITPQEAKDLYDIENLSSAVNTLRKKKGWAIVTDSRRGKSPKYFLMPGATQPDGNVYRSPLFNTQSSNLAQAEDLPEAVPELVSPLPSVIKAASPISILNVRLGPQGPEIQMVPAGEPESDHPFCRPSPAQIRYLSVNLKLFADLDEETRR